MENVGEKIYNLRKEKGVSQEELAEAVNVARPTISRWENNTVIPTTENIQKLCAFFGVEINCFLSEEEIAVVNAGQEIQPVAGEIKPSRFKTLKIVSAVLGITALIICVIVCGIAAYAYIMPDEEWAWTDTVDSVNYEGIIFLILGIFAFVILITLAVIFIKKYIKNRKKK